MDNKGWEQWKDYILIEYCRRMKNMASFGTKFGMNQNGISAIILSAESLELPEENMFYEILKIKSGIGAIDKSKNGGISMLGHRFGMFGMVESFDNISKYLTEAHQSLGSNSGMILTSIYSPDLNYIKNHSINKSDISFQSGNLFGPYFGMFFIDSDFLKNQVNRTEWQLKAVYQQEDGSYSMIFSGR